MIEPVLSDEELSDVIEASRAVEGVYILPYTLARAVEYAVIAKQAEKQEPATYAIYDSQGYCETRDSEQICIEFCKKYNARDVDPLKPYSYRPLYTRPSPQDALRVAAQAVIERWDGSSWKYQEHTVAHINALREALK